MNSVYFLQTLSESLQFYWKLIIFELQFFWFSFQLLILLLDINFESFFLGRAKFIRWRTFSFEFFEFLSLGYEGF